MTQTVVAVPRSHTASGVGYCAIAATAPATRSLPSWDGLSIKIFNPVFTPGPITNVSLFKIFSAASLTT